MWVALLLAFLVGCAIVGGLAIALRRAFSPSIRPTGQPTPDDAKIHLAHEQARATMTGSTPSGAQVLEMSNEDLEKLANDRTSIDPGKR